MFLKHWNELSEHRFAKMFFINTYCYNETDYWIIEFGAAFHCASIISSVLYIMYRLTTFTSDGWEKKWKKKKSNGALDQTKNHFWYRSLLLRFTALTMNFINLLYIASDEERKVYIHTSSQTYNLHIHDKAYKVNELRERKSKYHELYTIGPKLPADRNKWRDN